MHILDLDRSILDIYQYDAISPDFNRSMMYWSTFRAIEMSMGCVFA